MTATDEIAVGVSTLSALGKRVGDRVTVSTGDRRAELRVVGSATFPAIGVGGADHPSLGRGAILTFQALSDLVSPGVECLAAEEGLCPRAVVFDVAPGADGDAVAERIAGANPDGLPGGTYPHPVSRPADIRNYDQMASLPVALASVLAAAAVVALILTLFASARARRRDLAVLKVLGATAAQLRAAVAAQAITVAAAAVIVGLPLGIAAGRLSWIRFADDAGVLAVSTVPLVVLFGLAIGLIAVCAVTALLPATLAARTVTSRALRTE